ncbi:hypothetical protein ACF061_14170 [Streptomyces sp. NPDC015220]|uniref:hypothetical protein n=1 Tax=Streptomyces sp. NPDC015220 TaxID=3364947 RepID=UPI0036F70458
MPEHVSILMWFGVAVPAALIIACAIVLAGYRYGLRLEIRRRRPAQRLAAVPPQRTSGPHREYVELSAAERAAFAGLMRQLGDG